MHLSRSLVAAAGAALLLTACGGGSPSGTTPASPTSTPTSPAAADRTGSTAPAPEQEEQPEEEVEQLSIVAAFYPIEYAVQRVAGDRAEIITLTAPGIDPHDVELSPRDVGTVGSADLVVYSSGMQAAVDDAVARQAGDSALDVAPAADLVATGRDDDDDHDDDDHDHGHDDEDEHGHDDDEDEHGHDHGGVDPHFWLDPERYAQVGEAIAARLAELDPAHATTYESNAADFVADLTALDEEFATGLAQCAETDVVTTHAAFGYLTDRYGLHQIGMTGISPESEPSPARMAEITRVVREHGVSTIYSEVILGSALADTIAAETGAQVMVLDPIEGITTDSAADDYFGVMRVNLETLRTGQGCD